MCHETCHVQLELKTWNGQDELDIDRLYNLSSKCRVGVGQIKVRMNRNTKIMSNVKSHVQSCSTVFNFDRC